MPLVVVKIDLRTNTTPAVGHRTLYEYVAIYHANFCDGLCEGEYRLNLDKHALNYVLDFDLDSDAVKYQLLVDYDDLQSKAHYSWVNG